MTPASFKSWRERLYGPRGQTAAAKALGCSRTSVQNWERGWAMLPAELAARREVDGGKLSNAVPAYIALAAAALEANLPPMP